MAASPSSPVPPSRRPTCGGRGCPLGRPRRREGETEGLHQVWAAVTPSGPKVEGSDQRRCGRGGGGDGAEGEGDEAANEAGTMVRFLGYFVLNAVLMGISPVLTVLLFSALGEGPKFYVALHDWRSYRYIFAGLGVAFSLALYLGDLCLPRWNSQEEERKGVAPALFPSVLAKVVAALAGICICLAWLLSIGTYPSAPLLLVQLLLLALVLRTAVHTPSGATTAPQSIMRAVTVWMPTTRSESFNIAQVSALFIHGLWTFFLWVFWVGDSGVGGGPNSWNDVTRMKLEEAGINEARFGSSVQNVMLYLWMAPAISSGGLWTAAVVVMFVGSLERSLRKADAGVEEDPAARLSRKSSRTRQFSGEGLPQMVVLTRAEEAKIGKLLFTIKILTAALVVLCGILWITASIVGSSLSLAATVQAFTVVFACFLGVYIYIALCGENRDLMQRGAIASPLMKSARGVVESDWAKSVLLSIMFLPLPFYLLLSFCNQLVRRCRGSTGGQPARVHPVEPAATAEAVEAADSACSDKGPGWFTERVELQMRQLRTWNWTIVHKDLQLLCMLAVSLQVVGGMGTNIFLAWVNNKLSGAGFTTLTGMFFLVGTGMFMIPIVPGIAVYLFGGILIPSGYVRYAGTPGDFTHDTFWIGCAITVGLNFLLKMVAIILQQKGIGEPMSTNFWVLQTVGANTPQMKAIELMLKRPGINFPKVTILCGGPDWPTSVLTGILRLSLPQMLLGSIPVILNVLFVTAAGAFRLRKAESDTWSAMSSVALTVASVWTVLQMALAAYYIQDTWEKNHEQLSKPRKEHIELDWLDRVAAEQQRYRNTVTDWGALPCFVKGVVFSASALMLTSSFYMVMLQSRCWDDFEVTDDLSELGVGFIKMEGRAAIGVFAIGCLLHFSVQLRTRFITRSECKEIAKKLGPKKGEWIEQRKQQCEEGIEAEVAVSLQEVADLRADLASTKQELQQLRDLLQHHGILPAHHSGRPHHTEPSRVMAAPWSSPGDSPQVTTQSLDSEADKSSHVMT